MNNSELEKFRGILADIRTSLADIRAQSLELSDRIDKNRLPDTEMAARLSRALANYQQNTVLLQQTGASLSISIDDDLGKIEDALVSAETLKKRREEEQLISDYFRLTAQAEDVRTALEASKRLLSEKSDSSETASANFLEPYKIVVNRVHDGRDCLSDSEYTLVREKIGEMIARASDRDSISIDASHPVSDHLKRMQVLQEAASSGETAAEPDATPPAAAAADTPAADDCRAVTESTANTSAVSDVKAETLPQTDGIGGESLEAYEEPVPPETQPLPLWKSFAGYVGDTEIEIQDEPASSLGASKFISTVKQKTGMSFAIYMLAHQKYLAEDDTQSEDDRYLAPAPELQTYLLNHGFFMEVTISRDGWRRSFLTLTSKSWACFKKPEVEKYLKSKNFTLPKKAFMPLSDLNSVNALRLMAIHDHFSGQDPRQNFLVYFTEPARFPYACTFSNRKIENPVCAAAFEEGGEAQVLAAIRLLAANLELGATLDIIVFSTSDIPLLTDALCLSEADCKRVRYFTADAPRNPLDSMGQPTANGAFAVLDTDRAIEEDLSLVTNKDDETARNGSPTDPPEAAPNASNPQQLTEPRPTSAAAAREEDMRNGCDSSAEQPLSLYSRMALDLLLSNKPAEALAMSKAISRYDDEAAVTYRRLAYALDDPALDKKYKYTKLQQVFDEPFGQNLSYDALGLAAYLRMFFSDEIREEPYFISSVMTILDENRAFEAAPQLKELMFALSEQFSQTNRGFDVAVLNSLLNSKGRQNRTDQYRVKANALLNSRLEETNVGNLRLKETRNKLFGVGSMLNNVLIDASRDDVSTIPFIKENLSPYLNTSYEPGTEYTIDTLSDDALNGLIDVTWNALSQSYTRQRHDALKGAGRNNILNRVKEVISTCITWASLKETSDIDYGAGASGSKFKKLQGRADELMRDSEQALDIWQTEPESAPAFEVLKATLRELHTWLMNGSDPNRNKYYYLNFLKGNFVEVDGNYMPYLETDFEDVTAYSICKRISELSAMDDISWEDVLGRIFSTENNDGCDFGHAELIKEYLMVSDPAFVWPAYYDIAVNSETAKANLNARYSDFLARLEMAENYGWVDSTEIIDRISADMEKRKQHYLETENYGFYFRTMGAYLKNLEREAEAHKLPRMQRLTALRNSAGSEYPIFAEIERLIDGHMYTVAQDYMDQVEKEGRQEVPESVSLVSEDSALEKFISAYSGYYRDAKEAEKTKLTVIYNRHHAGEENNLVKTGRTMLETWPKSMGGSTATSERMLSFFISMGLPADKVTFKDNAHFFVSFSAQEATADYPHPIGIYGSEMLKKGLHAFLLFGSKDAVTMNTAIRKLMTASISGASVIFVDTQLSLSDKKKLSQIIKSENQNRNPYLIIDRVMLLHLANQPQAERWNIFLKCALPFHYLNPYVESNTVEIYPEMFIGRRNELEQVTSVGGANIICGGRQLGKTALLHRARKLEDSRSAGKWSIFIDIKQENAASTAVRIYEKLTDEGFLTGNNKQVDWNALTRMIINRINSGMPKVERFLLLLDEADNFLVDCQKSNYVPVDCLKRMQVETDNRFKFVLAGLHNVMRFHEKVADANSTLPQLSTITIEPLPFKEASELLERPLSYLGFRMKQEDIPLIAQILSSTNYYPGLIQFYASRLVRAVCQDSSGDTNEKPPYWLQEAQIIRLLKDPEFLTNIKDKFMITLGIDQSEKGYYRTLSNVLAYCYFDSPEGSSTGYTVEQIYDTCRRFDIYSITELSLNQVSVLLDELIGLNVLRKNLILGDYYYIFNRTSFRHMLGDEKGDVENVLLEIMDKELQAHES